MIQADQQFLVTYLLPAILIGLCQISNECNQFSAGTVVHVFLFGFFSIKKSFGAQPARQNFDLHTPIRK